MRRRAPHSAAPATRLLWLVAVAVLACGRYGPPLREPPAPTQTPSASERPGGALVPAPAAPLRATPEPSEEEDR